MRDPAALILPTVALRCHVEPDNGTANQEKKKIIGEQTTPNPLNTYQNVTEFFESMIRGLSSGVEVGKAEERVRI